METSSWRYGSYAQKIIFSPDGRYGFVTLTGKTPLVGQSLEEAEAFCKRSGQLCTEFFRYRYHHFLCVLDLTTQEVWCPEGHAANAAWIAKLDYDDLLE